MIRLAIFASGSGSNAERICDYFSNHSSINIDLFLTNNLQAGIIERGKRLGIPTIVFDKKSFSSTDKILNILQKQEIDFIILAGFLWLIPDKYIQAFPNRIINIHPALLPKYGGKGMWGHHVHEAVVQNQEKESGITIHYVNEHYDEGKIIFQTKCTVDTTDSPEDVAKKIQFLEHKHFPIVIENLLKQQSTQNLTQADD